MKFLKWSSSTTCKKGNEGVRRSPNVYLLRRMYIVVRFRTFQDQLLLLWLYCTYLVIISCVLWTPVTHPLFISSRAILVIRWTCGLYPIHHPLHFRSRRESGPPFINGCEMTSTKTGRGMYEFLIKLTNSAQYERKCLSDGVHSDLCACAELNSPPNLTITDLTTFAEQETGKKRIRPETNGLKKLFSVSR